MDENANYTRRFTMLPSEVMMIDHKQLSSTAKLVYSVIYTMLNSCDSFYMSNKVIGERVGNYKPVQISRCVSSLTDLGLIKVKMVTDENGGYIGRLVELGEVALSKKITPPYQKRCGGHIKNDKGALSKTINKDISKNRLVNISSSRGSYATDTSQSTDNAFKLYKDLWNAPNSFVKKDLADWINNYSDKLVSYAISIAGRNNVTKQGAYKYLDTILTSWNEAGIRTVDEAKEQNEKHNRHLDHVFKSRKHVKEKLPDWAKKSGKTTDKSKLNPVDKNKVDEMRKRLNSMGEND